ncbi:hypothetical protein Tco_0184293 [Tanacetum coccineum]
MARVKGNVLDAEIQIILLENVQSHREIRTKELSSGGSWSDSGEKDDEKIKDKTCLVAQAPNENEKLKEEDLKLTKFEKSTHCLNEMLSNQKPSGEKLGSRFSSFKASSSGTKEIKFVKAHKKASSDGDELESHPAYDFFAPAPLPGYAGNPNNNNGWLTAKDYLLGELEAMVDEQMVVPAIEEVTEPVVEAEEEQVIAPVFDMEEGQIDATTMDMEEDPAALFGNDDFEDDASDGFSEDEVWEVNEDWLMAPSTPPPMLTVPPPSVYEVGGPSTAVAEGPSFPHSALGLPVPQFVIEDLKVAVGVTIGELGPRVYDVEGQALQIDVQQRDTHIQQLQTRVTEMSSRESTLMRCILGLERRIAALERRPPGP